MCVCVYVCVCACSIMCSYFADTSSLIEGSAETWIVGAVHAKDVNNCIGRYFEIFEVTKVLESYY
jgi:hypothetical protein